MDEYLAIILIKNFFINIFIYFTFMKIVYKTNMSYIKFIKVIVASIITTVIYALLRTNLEGIFLIIIAYITQICFLKMINKDEKQLIISVNLVANAIVYITFTFATIIEYIPKTILKIENNIFNLLIILIIEIIMLKLLFRLRRFKNGITFFRDKMKEDYWNIIMINVSAMIIFIYCLFIRSDGNLIKHFLIPFLILGITMFIMIQKTLTLYYKQKLLEQNLKSYEQEIADKDKQIQDLSDEKFKISKVNHEFYNRQRALEMAVKEFISNSNMETSKEIMIMDKIESLSKEYSGKIEEIKKVEKLPETEIEEIDEMFRYMQSECIKNNIEFSLKINGNIFYMINNLIETDRLVTLIGDHIRDAIIAINHSANNYRSIIATLGMNDNCYEFRVYDTGIEFEIDTLLKLGIEPATTHAEEGGSGIGFITTFETMKNSKASLIIEEKNRENNNDYTKAVIIRFDGKNEYRISSYRSSEIKNKCKDNRIKIDNN